MNDFRAAKRYYPLEVGGREPFEISPFDGVSQTRRSREALLA